jgi:hypothetical protein
VEDECAKSSGAALSASRHELRGKVGRSSSNWCISLSRLNPLLSFLCCMWSKRISMLRLGARASGGMLLATLILSRCGQRAEALQEAAPLVIGLNGALQRRVAFDKPLAVGSVNRAESSNSGVGGKGQGAWTATQQLSEARGTKVLPCSYLTLYAAWVYTFA